MNSSSLIKPIISNVNTSSNDPLSKYVCSWLKDQKIRQDLIKRIKYKKENLNPQYTQKIINDQTLTQQYFKIWMQQPLNKPLIRLVMHPLMQIQDQNIIQQVSQQQRSNQIKFSAQLTLGTVAIYWIFFSKMAKFQRFFNSRNKSTVINWAKKITGVYAILIAWQASLSSHYQKQLPDKINQKGLFKKYGIQYQEKNV